jgi:acyl dehydratase
MPVDVAKALAATLPEVPYAWDADRVILYHLGIGAGGDPTAPGELEYAYEKHLKVLPSFAVVPAFPFVGAIARIPGLTINVALVLHGEQDVELHRPIPTAAKVVTRGRVAGVYDKGKAALVVIEADTATDQGEKLFTNRFSIFCRGEGGFGGEPGPKPQEPAAFAAGNEAPDRKPDHVFESPTLPQQALLYRLSGDKNPLHADPEFAKMGGFERPILHGLCSFGAVCKAVVDGAAGGDVAKVTRYQARFAGVVFPGETIVTSVWAEGHRLVLAARTKERGTPVLSHAALTLR